MTEKLAKSLSRRLTASIVAVILLTAALSVTTFILVTSTVESGGHLFGTGSVRLNLNNGKPVIDDAQLLFEPGATVEKTFTVENLSTCDVWYQLYFTNVEGALADAVSVQILDGDTVLLSGRISDLTEKNTAACAESLAVGECKTLTVRFGFDSDGGNNLQDAELRFDFSAKAVQVRNNPDKSFS